MADLQRAMETPVPGAQPAVPDTGTVRKPRKPRRGVARKGQGKGRKRAKKTAKRAVGKLPLLAAPYGKQAKRVNARNAVSMDLGDALGLIAGMHRTDVPVFQAISEHLSAKGKPSRKRLLAAIVKVFG